MTTTRHALLLTLGAIALGGGELQGQAAAPAANRASVERMQRDLRYLADDAREGRGLGTAGLDSAAAYVARQFQQAGLQPGGSQSGGMGWFQNFTIDSTAPVLAHCGFKPAPVKNVIGIQPGKGRLAGQVVIVGAHYDHLGLGGCSSMSPDSGGKVHNGADDNASGTAGIMEMARAIRGRPAAVPDARAIVFIAFSAEELGALGSHYYVGNPVRPLDSTYIMINLDMVGRSMNHRLSALGAETAVELRGVLDTVNATHDLAVAASGNGWGASDHAEFYAKRLPVLHFFTGVHSDYHKSTDDWEKIDPDAHAAVTAYIADVAWAFATRPAPLTLVFSPPPQPMAGGAVRPYLGTLPDMSSTPGGVRISGTGPGSPAEKAGLKAGDILLKIGAKDVKSLEDMQAALVGHKPGDVVDIVVKRGDSTLTVSATLSRRGG